MKFIPFIISALLLAGCTSASVQSSGDGKYSIQCLNDVTRCHEKARNICDEGYLVTNRVRPVRVGDDTRYTLNIKCRTPTMF